MQDPDQKQWRITQRKPHSLTSSALKVDALLKSATTLKPACIDPLKHASVPLFAQLTSHNTSRKQLSLSALLPKTTLVPEQVIVGKLKPGVPICLQSRGKKALSGLSTGGGGAE